MQSATTTRGQAPNVIVIISDDAGYADFGFMDGLSGETSTIPTPNLDRLASQGVTFSNAYTAMVCSPSRAALTTGGYQQRVGYEFNINNLTDPNGPFEGLPVEADTIWERMKSVGYTTGAVGKWHIGSIDNDGSELGNRPQNQGVDEFYGLWRGSREYYLGSVTNQTRVIRETLVDDLGNVTDTVVESQFNGEYISNVFGDYAVDFIEDHHADSEPFFLYQAFTAPHGPLHDSPDINDPSIAHLSGNRQRYASAMLTMDKEIGRILDSVEDPNGDGDMSDSIADETMIVFINDNGGEDSIAADNGALRNYKDSPYEGGIRVPMVIAGAGIEARAVGSVYDAPVHSIDILPTAFAAGGGAFGPDDTGIDGVNLLPYVNGEVQEDPHEFLVVRLGYELGVRKGDWKLVKNGQNAAFELYNLASDIGESNDVAAANVGVVAELQKDLTDTEVEFDKPRFATLDSSQDTVNIFDRFTFRPGEGTSVPGPSILENGGFESGTQLDADPYYTFEELTAWSNNGDDSSPAKDEVAARDDNAAEGAYRGMLSGLRSPTQVTDHVISLGDEFSISLSQTGQFSGWDVGADSFNMELFYVADNGDLIVLETINVVPGGAWTNETYGFSAITEADAEGRLLGIRFDSLGGESEFAGLDDVSLGIATAADILQANWSAGGVWTDGQTGDVETMFRTDAFAGAELEFPVNGQSYISTNDMVRASGLEFMLNKLVFSGAYGSDFNNTGTIEGADLLLTDSLDGEGPQIAIEATNSTRGSGTFSYDITLDLILYDDLTVTGDGTTLATISGAIRDYSDPRGLRKEGSSTVVLTGENTFSGDTVVAGGTLALAADGTLETSPLVQVLAGAVLDVVAANGGAFAVAAGQTLGGDGQVLGSVSVGQGGDLSPGLSVGVLTVSGDLVVESGGRLTIEVDGATADQISVSGELVAGGDFAVELAGELPGLGSQYDVLDFASVSGAFDGFLLPALPAGLGWDTSELLATGILAVESVLSGDYNGDGLVDSADFTVWRNSLGESGVELAADGDGSGTVDQADFNLWRDNYGAAVDSSLPVAVPEASGLGLLALVLLLRAVGRR